MQLYICFNFCFPFSIPWYITLVINHINIFLDIILQVMAGSGKYTPVMSLRSRVRRFALFTLHRSNSQMIFYYSSLYKQKYGEKQPCYFDWQHFIYGNQTKKAWKRLFWKGFIWQFFVGVQYGQNDMWFVWVVSLSHTDIYS